MDIKEHNQQLKRKSLRHAVFFIFIAFIVLIYFTKNQQKSETSERENQNVMLDQDQNMNTDLEGQRSVDVNSVSVGSLEASEPNEYFERALSECLSLNSSVPIKNSNELVKYLMSLNPKRNIEIENYHIKLAQGEERRIHLIPKENGDSGSKKEMRYFKLDKDGIPERIELPAEVVKLKTQDQVLALLSQGQLTFKQSKEVWLFEDEMSLNVDFQNNKVFEFQLQVQTQSFSCRVNDCECTGL